MDPNGDFTVIAANELQVDTMRRDAIAYFYKNYTAGHFGDLTHYIRVDWNAAQALGIGVTWAITNIPASRTDMIANSDGINTELYYRSTTNADRTSLRCNNTMDLDDYDQVHPNGISVTYYYTITRSGAATTLDIYSDAARTILTDTLVIVSENAGKRYLMAAASYDSAVSGANTISYDIMDLDLNEPSQTTYGRLRGVAIWG